MRPWEDVCRMARALNGIPVLQCRRGSPAALAGVRYGDILLSVDGQPTPDWGSYIEARAGERDEMVIEIFRDGQTLTLRLPLTRSETPIDPLTLLEELAADGEVPAVPTPDPFGES